MLRIAASVLMLVGTVSFVRGADPPTDSRSQSSSSSDYHVPSAGVTLDTLRMLPPPYNHWSSTPNQQPIVIYAPTYTIAPYYTYPYGFRSYGLGGYYPQGVGGRYPSRLGWWLW